VRSKLKGGMKVGGIRYLLGRPGPTGNSLGGVHSPPIGKKQRLSSTEGVGKPPLERRKERGTIGQTSNEKGPAISAWQERPKKKHPSISGGGGKEDDGRSA